MRPIKLEIQGIQSFVNNEIIDFENLSSRGIFGIFGATGSGKSTILDCIILSLYGRISRTKVNADFLNNRCKFGKVNLVFSFVQHKKTHIFEVERTFKKKKETNEADQSAVIYEVYTLGKKQIMEGPLKVDGFIRNLLGMGETEFTKVIALPQNEFASFLKAKPNERINIIGNMFDLNKYGNYIWDKATANQKDIESKYNAITSKIEMIEKLTDEDIINFEKDLESKQVELASNENQLAVLSVKLDQDSKIFELSKNLGEINTRIETIESSSDTIDNSRVKYHRAVKIKGFTSQINRLDDLNNNLLQNESELKILDAKKIDANNSVKNCEENYNNISKINNEKLEANIIAIQKLKASKEDETKLANIIANTLELEKSKDVVNAKIDSEQKNVDFYTQEIEKCNQKTSVNNKELENISISLEKYAGNINFANVSKEIQTLENISKVVSSKIDQVNDEKKVNKDLIEKKNNELFEIKSKLDKVKEGINSYYKADQNQKTTDRLLGASKSLAVLDKSYSFVQLYNSEIVKLKLENDSIIDDIKETDQLVDKLLAEYNDLSNNVSKLKSTIESIRIEREENIGEVLFGEIVASVNIGDICPVCKSQVIQKNYVPRNDLSGFDQLIKTKTIELTNLENAKEKLNAQIEAYKSKIESGNLRIKINQKKIVDFQKLIENEYIKFVDLNAYAKDNFERLRTNLQNAIKSLAELVELESSFEQSTIELNKTLESLISTNTTLDITVEKLNQIYICVSEIIAEKQFLHCSLSSNKDEYLEISNSIQELQKRRKDIENDNREIARQKDIYSKQVEDSKVAINELKIELASIVSKLETYKASKNEIEATNNFGDKPIEEQIKLIENNNNLLKLEIVNTEKTLKEQETELNSIVNKCDVLSAKISALKAEISSIEKTLQNLADELNIADIASLKEYLITAEEETKLRELLSDYDNNYNVLLNKRKELNEKLKDNFTDESILSSTEKQIKELRLNNNELRDKIGEQKAMLVTKKKDLETGKVLNAELSIISKKLDTANELVQVLRGKGLMEFVAEEFIESITLIASEKLSYLLDGRYTLTYKNKDFYVVDNFEDGSIRSVVTLSGGETFVVSLSLALAISESFIASSDKSIDFFFLDEGFGTLDSNLCEWIINSLIKLESKNITIGLISHVPELKELIKDKLIVTLPSTKEGTKVQLVNEI